MPLDLAMRNDQKVGALEEENPALVTLWIYLLSMMYEEKGPLERNYRRLAYLLRFPTPEDVRHVVEDSGLFVYDDTHFWNESALERIERKDAFIEQQREAGRRGGRPRKSTPESDPLSDPLSDPFQKQKANKSNKSNQNKEINQGAGAGAPTREEDDFLIYEFFFRNMRKPGQEVARCLENYKDQGVRDWKAVASKWAPADTAPRFDDPRALQWAKLLYTYVGTAADKAEACECLRHIDDIKVDRVRNELTVRMRGGDWKDAVRDTIAQNAGLYMDFEAINVSKCANT